MKYKLIFYHHSKSLILDVYIICERCQIDFVHRRIAIPHGIILHEAQFET